MRRILLVLSLLMIISAFVAAVMLQACAAYKNGNRATESARRATDDGFAPQAGFADLRFLPAVPSGSGRVGATPQLAANEELWIIQRPAACPPTPGDDSPGSGALVTRRTDPATGVETDVPVPLKHTDVKAAIAGYIATVDVTQQFHNPYSGKIEAVYVFPLPDNAAVNEFVMTVGDRRIRGIIREREQAEQIYQDARAQGHVASILTQERPNIFTQKVANIEPGKAIDINIRYYHTLAYMDGGYEFVFPMVVGPRFNPPSPGSTDGIGAAPRGRPGSSGQSTEVQSLRPGERSGHDISLALSIDAGVSIESVASRTHVVAIDRPAPDRAEIKLSELDSLPNRDFVLRYSVAGKSIKSSFLVHRDEKSGAGYFTLMLVPPADLGSLDRSPMEMVFVIDCSGSMAGQPIQQAKAAAQRGLKRLRPGDTFQVIDFAQSASQLGAYPVEANAANVSRGNRYIESLNSNGGTMMKTGLKAALDFPHDPERLRVVSFLTDGYIGNEAEILRELHGRLGATRVFSFGVGSSANRYLMERMAKIGRGAAAFLALDDPAPEVMDLFFDRVSHPALTDLALETGSARVTEVYPSHLPDLFVGRPVIITGRFEGEPPSQIRVTGKAGGKPVTIVASPDDAPATPALAPGRAALPLVWARMKIADLADRANWESPSELVPQARQVALDYGLMSAWTAFVAVDSLSKTSGDFGTTVAVPVPVPAGVRYETTGPEGSSPQSRPPEVVQRRTD